MRLGQIILVLLAFNLLSLLWFFVRGDLTLAPKSQYADFNRQDPGASLLLESERPNAPLSDRFLVSGDSPQAVTGQEGRGELSDNSVAPDCYMLGDFVSEADAVAAMDGLSISYRVVVREAESVSPIRYRVRSAIAPDREAGLQRLAELRRAIAETGVSIDSYLVTSGPMQNAVSLGLFNEHSNALNVQRLLQVQGEEVLVEIERSVENRFQILFQNGYPFEFNSESWDSLGLTMVRVDASENVCETIAQAE